MTDWFAKVPPRVASSIAPYPRDRGWAGHARRIVGVSIALWAFVAGLAFAILRVAGVV